MFFICVKEEEKKIKFEKCLDSENNIDKEIERDCDERNDEYIYISDEEKKIFCKRI